MHYDQLKTITAILSKSKENSDISDTNCDYLSSFFSIIRNIFSVEPIRYRIYLVLDYFQREELRLNLFNLLSIQQMQYASDKKNYINIIFGTILYTSSQTLVA